MRNKSWTFVHPQMSRVRNKYWTFPIKFAIKCPYEYVINESFKLFSLHIIILVTCRHDQHGQPVQDLGRGP